MYSNLFNVARSWWGTFGQDGVTLATSYYSDTPAEHDKITGKPGSYLRSRSNIEEALRRGIPLYVGIVDVLPDQRVDAARAELQQLGVTHINTDWVRAVGRGALPGQSPTVDDLCGRCTRGRAAVLPNGDLAGCVLARNFPAGNVLTSRLRDLFNGASWAELSASIPPRRSGGNPCNPDCNPSKDGSDCAPAEQEACDPAY
ncbi:SPASM domain-containing protein [Streptomyces sp. NPDC020412]|uniref:SPASM domain-containing protein n=1 Tax=Streptomyces sp. NPDC020412 TaxID=3365073 RepID=UPI0037A17CA9